MVIKKDKKVFQEKPKTNLVLKPPFGWNNKGDWMKFMIPIDFIYLI